MKLGHKSNCDDLVKWATNELNGYLGQAELPEFRIRRAVPRIDIANQGGILQGASLQDLTALKLLHDNDIDIAIVEFRQPILELEAVANSNSNKDNIAFTHPHSEMAMYLLNNNLQNDSTVIRLYHPVERDVIDGICKQVATKALELTLQLQRNTPWYKRVPSSETVQRVVTVVLFEILKNQTGM